jgi:hypothetical protein
MCNCVHYHLCTAFIDVADPAHYSQRKKFSSKPPGFGYSLLTKPLQCIPTWATTQKYFHFMNVQWILDNNLLLLLFFIFSILFVLQVILIHVQVCVKVSLSLFLFSK